MKEKLLPNKVFNDSLHKPAGASVRFIYIKNEQLDSVLDFRTSIFNADS